MATFIAVHLIAVVLALILDSLIGDPEHWPHPVRWFGSWIALLDKHLNKGKFKKEKGLIIVLSMGVWALIFVSLLVYGCYQLHLALGIIVEAIIISTTVASTSLAQAAAKVEHPLKRKEIEAARYEVSMIVGRDTDQLSESEVVRATVETVAENTSDGVTAPLFYAFIGGSPLALFYRAINTCDSMVGYKNEKYAQFGYFSAKTDDLLNYIPSRLTAIVMVLANLKYSDYSFAHVWRIVKRDARKHPSPNSGFGESVIAALLGVQLGGRNTYKGVVSNRAKMGDPFRTLTIADIDETVRMMRRTVLAYTLLFLVIGGILIVFTNTWG
ncbi:adenosylcobinamide-phosphate synthase CbiB [Bacillus sp. CGMCC 1.16541]|uniref:adenosylcobinamide-phosphate synthase CbiB n=1 Tax=Bacillus sp. CGMCC 1.16541 TaxID=2185143 RepID=UPI000D7354D5|nr:adenosylcobinamide-phosphate synthase CbiB [Bacillus sp. CGMCC 1.16541]